MNKSFSIVKRTSDEFRETKFELLETLSIVYRLKYQVFKELNHKVNYRNYDWSRKNASF